MLSSSIPVRFPIPFANNAGGGYIETIPTASQIGITDGRASLHDGFPPLNFADVGAGSDLRFYPLRSATSSCCRSGFSSTASNPPAMAASVSEALG